MAEKSEKRRIYIYVNGKEVEDNLRSLTSQSRKLRNEIAGLSPGTKEFTEKAKDLQKINGRIGDIRKETNGMNGVLGKAKGLMSGLGGALLGGGIIAGITSLAKGIWDLTSNMEQIEKKSKIVFGSALPAITKAAEENADKMGIANSEYVKLATNNADLLKPMGFTTKASADMTVKTLELAGALSEWTGGTKTSAETMEIATKAMLGEREQLKTLGIAIQEADVKNRLMANGKDKLTGLALQQAKAEATLQLMLEKSTDAQNAYNDSSTSMLRKKKTFTAFWGDIKDAVGNAFIQAGTDISYFADNVMLYFNKIKQTSNDVLGTSFEVEPVENFTNAIVHTDKRFQDYTKTIEKFGLGTKEGKQAMMALGATMVDVYGAEKGKKIFDAFLAEQQKALGVQLRQEKAQQQFSEDASINSAKEKAAKEGEVVLKERAKLQEKIDKLKEDAKLKALTDDEAELEQIRQKFARLMEEEAINEEQKKELELLREEELLLKEEEQEIKRQEQKQKLLDEQYAFEEELELIKLEGIDKELAESDQKYKALIDKAKKFGLDTGMLEHMHQEDRLSILKKSNEEEAKNIEEVEARKRAARHATYEAVAGLIENGMELAGVAKGDAKAVNTTIALADTYASANKAYFSQLVTGDPTSPIRAAIAAASAVAAGLVNVRKIQGLSEGGPTGKGFGLADSTGFKVAGYVHEDEWVGPKWMVESPQYADTFKMLEAARQAKSGFAEGGPTTSSTTSTTPTFESSDSSSFTAAVNRLSSILEGGIRATTVIDQNNLLDIKEGLDEISDKQQLLN